jgi:hypothetical protein
MFQFPGFAPAHYVFMCRSGRSQGLPHSEMYGSKLVRSSPYLIAAYHVLHRLSVPRHPPNALKSLDRSHYQCPSGIDIQPRQEIGWTDIDRKTYCASICLLWAVKLHSRGSRLITDKSLHSRCQSAIRTHVTAAKLVIGQPAKCRTS